MEQASERRATDGEELSRTELVDPLTEPRKHKKPAVSVSQFGKVNVSSSRWVRFLIPTSKERTVYVHWHRRHCLPQHPGQRSTIHWPT